MKGTGKSPVLFPFFQVIYSLVYTLETLIMLS